MSSFDSALESAVRQAQRRVTDKVGADIEKQLSPALATFVASAAATDSLVERLCVQLESRVEDRASAVVTRLARDEAANHNLSRALEERVDARLHDFCAKLAGGTAAVLVLGAAWSWFGGGKRDR
jgi:hypothetical protein